GGCVWCDSPKHKVVSRGTVLSLFGLSAAWVPAAPRFVWTAPAEAQAIPPAFNQVDKPLPGEGGGARPSPQLEKPIPADEVGPKIRKPRRKRPRDRRSYGHKRRGAQRELRQPGSPEHKPR